MRIYTRTGDKGTTSLLGGTRIPKDDIRIEAYGTVDELNSNIGVLNDHFHIVEMKDWIFDIQDHLFIIGSNLAADPEKPEAQKIQKITEADITELENRMDRMTSELQPLRSFILPGGHIASSTAHVCRSVCRRAERRCIHLKNSGAEVSDLLIKYLNRLSDFFFVLSRYILLRYQKDEIIWKGERSAQ